MLIIIMTIGLLASCDIPIGGPTKFYDKYSTSFITRYISPDFLEVEMLPYNDSTIFVKVAGKEYSVDSKRREKEIFDSLSVANSDTAYNRQARFYTSSKKGVDAAISDKIKTLHIYTEMAYDDNHPCGSLLDDCITVSFLSCYPYVSSGYSLDELHQWTGIRSSLSEVIWKDESMISPMICLKIKPLPVSFTVELINEKGKVIRGAASR